MAPSAALQSRISAFESLESGNNKGRTKLSSGVRLEPLALPRKPVQQHILDSDSTSPTADALFSIPPIQPVINSSGPPSPAALGRKSSLIDFSELASPKLSVDGTGSTSSSTTSTSDSSKKPHLPLRNSQIPPLPPRKPSIMSLKVQPSTTPITTPPPLPRRHASSPINSSLLNPPDSHTYPPVSPRHGTSSGIQSRHMPSSSTSSFHSVSLSSDGGDTKESLDGSYEAVSSTAATSPTVSVQHDWEHDAKATPKVPQLQWQKHATSPPNAPIVGPSRPTARRPPPPPPQRRLVKPESSQPVTSAHRRVIPLPPGVKKRYDALFERNLPQTPRKSRASGWRGLSVDLLTNGEKPDFMHDSSGEERLDGTVIKRIWSCSRLPRVRLREIWMECDPDNIGSLDRDAFAKGMWRIDEALTRAHQQSPKEAALLTSKPIPISYAPRAPLPPLRKPNFLLR